MLRLTGITLVSAISIASVAVAANPTASPPSTTSFVRSYYTSHNTDISNTGPSATSAASEYSKATADYGHLTVETTSIPVAGGTGKSTDAGAFADSSVSDTLYLDFGAADPNRQKVQLVFDFTVAGQAPTLDAPPLPADVGWMNANAGWSLTLPNPWRQISGSEYVNRYHGYYQYTHSSVTNGSNSIVGNFEFVTPYYTWGQQLRLVPFSYDLTCGVGNQEVVVSGTQGNCLDWSFAITGIHVLDLSGQPLNVSVSAASTYDYNGSGKPIIPPTFPVPEPASWALIFVGLLAIGAVLRERRVAASRAA